MKRTLSLFGLAVVAVWLFGRCAKMPGSIGGGPKDETPPVFLYSSPPQNSVKIDTALKRIEMYFDEYLQLKDASNQFQSSLPMMKTPEILLYGKRIRVNLKESLKPNVTYNFNFGEAITDNNEGNKMVGFSYVFSTGNVVDSLTYTGRVLTAFDLRPGAKDEKLPMMVMLYKDFSDSAVYKSSPFYVTRADKLGFFTFSNLRADTFRIFALRDAGNNLRFDMPTEEIAFADTSIVINEDFYRAPDIPFPTSLNLPDSIKTANPDILHKDIELFSFVEAPVKQWRTGYERPAANMLRFTYSLPVDSLPIRIIDEPKSENEDEDDDKKHHAKNENDEERKEHDEKLQLSDNKIDTTMMTTDSLRFQEKWYVVEPSPKRDTIAFWITDTTLVNRKALYVEIQSPRTDSLGNLIVIADTLKLSFETKKKVDTRSRRERRRDEKEGKIQIERTPVQMTTITSDVKDKMDLKTNFQVFASQPVDSVFENKITLCEVADSLCNSVPFAVEKDSANMRHFTIKWDVKEDATYKMTVDSMAFKSIYGVFNDSTGFKFTTRKQSDYSSIEIQFSHRPCPLLVQVMPVGKETVMKQVTLKEGENALIDYLLPAKYRIKLVFDANGNGRWDTGLYLKRRQPERVAYYEQEIETKADWKTEIKWNLNNIK